MTRMKIMGARGEPTDIPFSLLNEDWAAEIHSQSLAELNSRGGMSPAEIVGNVRRLPFHKIVTLPGADVERLFAEILREARISAEAEAEP